ncbi:MAG: PilZ domain-containing protein [Candidatus Omnitrophota bacterium]|nr:PilZ domain-containing protein [Candidatus Omnitrophota bacterium]MBU1929248.1 PilZ domain-containing protein [Candidatus Omnitrophota bacterium]MBU2034369.1 PilZ domain-containing protein [Candidatus Omnitrophota bacterium]MBU2221556.1 PilZ domain-containing protein [Candidatus Omnitrophota bacterium]MBU2258102.1 PilZ domain-containing protein [Candidatus Omnitrophota bacterium]
MIRRLKGAERREHPRIEAGLSLKVAVNGYDFSTITRNVSCVGAYCHIPKYVPPFTRVNIKMNLPISRSGKENSTVECSGVIVRSEDEAAGGFNVAIFFNRINETAKHKISRYLSRYVPSYSNALLKTS